jgi:hypothetical protein
VIEMMSLLILDPSITAFVEDDDDDDDDDDEEEDYDEENYEMLDVDDITPRTIK